MPTFLHPKTLRLACITCIFYMLWKILGELSQELQFNTPHSFGKLGIFLVMQEV